MPAAGPWWLRMPMFGNLGYPLAVREIRSLLRSTRYFWSQFAYLVVLALGVTAMVSNAQRQGTITPEEIGTDLFYGFFVLQAVLVSVLFPAFAATSFSSERVEHSYELLLATDLHPVELVWGKFLGIFGSCCLFLLVTVPILGTCLLFGGVAISDVISNYLLLAVVAAMLTIYGIWVSSCTASNVRAIVLTYLPVVVLSSAATVVLIGWFDERTAGTRSFLDVLIPSGADIETLVAVGYVLVAFFVICFIAAIQRLSNVESAISSPMRIGASVMLFIGLLTIAAAGPHTSGELRPIKDFHSQAKWLASAIGLAAVLFASGRVITPLRTARSARRRRGWRRCVWPFLPGGVRGVAFGLLLIIVGFIGLWILAAVVFDLDHVAGRAVLGPWTGLSATGWVYALAMTAAAAYAGLAFLLACLEINGALNWGIVTGTAIALTLASVVHLTSPGHQFEFDSPLYATSIWVTLELYYDGLDNELVMLGRSLTFHATFAATTVGLGIAILRRRQLPTWRVARNALDGSIDG